MTGAGAYRLTGGGPDGGALYGDAPRGICGCCNVDADGLVGCTGAYIFATDEDGRSECG